MKMITILLLAALSVSFDAWADRFPGGEPGGQCRAGIDDDCGEGRSCQVIGYDEDPDYPGQGEPIYGCVSDEEPTGSALQHLSFQSVRY